MTGSIMVSQKTFPIANWHVTFFRTVTRQLICPPRREGDLKGFACADGKTESESFHTCDFAVWLGIFSGPIYLRFEFFKSSQFFSDFLSPSILCPPTRPTLTVWITKMGNNFLVFVNEQNEARSIARNNLHYRPPNYLILSGLNHSFPPTDDKPDG